MSAANEGLVGGWRGLSLAVGRRLDRPVGAAKVRWAVEHSGLPIGRRVGNVIVFDASEVEQVARMIEGSQR